MARVEIPQGFHPTGSANEYLGPCPDCGKIKCYWNSKKGTAYCHICAEGKQLQVFGRSGAGSIVGASLGGKRDGSTRVDAVVRDTGNFFRSIIPGTIAAGYLDHRGVTLREAASLGIKATRWAPHTMALRFGAQIRIVRRVQTSSSNGRHQERGDDPTPRRGIRTSLLHRGGQSWRKDGEYEYRNHFTGTSREDPWVLVRRRDDTRTDRVHRGNTTQVRGENSQDLEHILVIVEGQFDAIRCWRAGFNVVCCFGKPSTTMCGRILELAVSSLGKLYDGPGHSLCLATALDSDAAAEARRIHRFFRRWGYPAINLTPKLIELDRKDPDECTEEELHCLISGIITS